MSWKQVWAEAFVQEYCPRIKSPPPDVWKGKDDEWERWEVNQAAAAAEVAWSVVSRIMDAIPRIEEGWGKDSDVLRLAKQFVCDELNTEE
jgi:hypothetical protein